MKSTQKKHEMYMPNAKVLRWTQRNLYSTGLRLGFASGKMQLLGFASDKNAKKLASPNARDTNMLVYFALGNAKFWTAQRQPPTPGILRSVGI